MVKQKNKIHYNRYSGQMIVAKREVSYEMQLTARLILDEVCFNWNKHKLQEKMDETFKKGDREEFLQLSQRYKLYLWEALD